MFDFAKKSLQAADWSVEKLTRQPAAIDTFSSKGVLMPEDSVTVEATIFAYFFDPKIEEIGFCIHHCERE